MQADLLAVPCKPCKPVSKGEKRKLPGLKDLTQENINKMFRVEGKGKGGAKAPDSVADLDQNLAPPVRDVPKEDDNLALALMEEELELLLAQQRELEAEEQKHEAGEEDLRRLLAEEKLLEKLQEEEQALQAAILESMTATEEAPLPSSSGSMPPPPVPVKPVKEKPAPLIVDMPGSLQADVFVSRVSVCWALR